MTAQKNHVRLLFGSVLCGGLLLAGCAQTGSDRPAAEGTVSPIPSSSHLPLPSDQPSGQSGSRPSSQPSSQPSSRPSSKPSSKPTVSGPAIPPGAKGDPITLTGTVEKVNLEGGCTVLRVGTKTYELKGGDPAVIQPGARLAVRGVIRTDIVTVCQMGPVLEVLSTQPA